MRGLFVNSPKASCSIHESGVMAFQCLAISKKYSIDYIELHTPNVPEGYDFYVVNYHQVTLRHLNVSHLLSLGKPTFAFHLETIPHAVLAGCPGGFTGYLVPDPTIEEKDAVWAFPRPLEPSYVGELLSNPVPVIGMFGFATVGKDWEGVVQAVSNEFSSAIVRLNIPQATFVNTPEDVYTLIADACSRKKHVGIKVEITRDYLEKTELIEWCAGNDLNVFFYSRPGMTGLAACTDQAISSGRPIAVSSDITFRHLHRYIKPYPERSLREAIADTQSTKAMQIAWSRQTFMEKFEYVLTQNTGC